MQIAAGVDQLDRDIGDALTRNGFRGYDRVIALLACTWNEWKRSGMPIDQFKNAALEKWAEHSRVGQFARDMFKDGLKPR